MQARADAWQVVCLLLGLLCTYVGCCLAVQLAGLHQPPTDLVLLWLIQKEEERAKTEANRRRDLIQRARAEVTAGKEAFIRLAYLRKAVGEDWGGHTVEYRRQVPCSIFKRGTPTKKKMTLPSYSCNHRHA